jgi:hypothetical protein
VVLIFACIGALFLIPPAMAAMEVLLFHIYLIRHNITTYEYLSGQHKKNMAKKKAQMKNRKQMMMRDQQTQAGRQAGPVRSKGNCCASICRACCGAGGGSQHPTPRTDTML